MKVVDCEKQRATVLLSYDEISTLNNALNEVCNALDIAEFATRMGADENEVQVLLQQFHTLSIAMQEKEGKN